MPKDYYIVLGVSRGANLDKIKKAYRTVAKKYHPDISPSEENRKRFMEIKEAYETLSDVTKRKNYDQALERKGSQLRTTKVPDIIESRRSIFDEVERVFSSAADDFFEGFLPGFFDLEKGKIREKDLFFEAILSPGEAAKGGLFPITVPVIETCPRCGKTGFWEDFFCPICHGYGRVESEREFSLSIPPNVRHGTKIRLSMEDIGLKDCSLNVMVLIDPCLEEEV
jgi:DnaJ-class molecular chaperone